VKTEQAVIESALKLAEHLMQDHKRKIVDPLIASTALILAKRFRAQRKALDDALGQIEPLTGGMAGAVPSAVSVAIATAFKDFRYPLFDASMDAATRSAFDSGWGIAADQLDREDEAPDRQFNPLVSDQIDGTTRDLVMAAVTAAFATSASFDTLRADVDQVFADAVETRAEMTATTEIASAFNSGAEALMTTAKNDGAQIEKLWSAEPDACDDCQENADQDWIDDDEMFASGDDAPPAHPFCRCSLELRTANG